jgi:hypothetical protein
MQEKLGKSGLAGAAAVVEACEVVQAAFKATQVAYDTYRTSRFFQVGLPGRHGRMLHAAATLQVAVGLSGTVAC